jgi:hypothetical protein
VRLAGGAADVDAVRVRPAHDRQAARQRIAAARRAGVAEQGEADAAARHGAGELRRRDELAALAVGEDQHRAAVAGDELADLGRRAGGELVGGAGAAEVGGEGVDSGLRERAGAPGVLRAVVDCGDRGGGGDGEDGREDGGTQRSTSPRGQRDARAEACRDCGVDAGQVARSQVGHRTGDGEARDEPERQRRESSARDVVQPAMGTEGESHGQGGERGRCLDADPGREVRLRGEEPQRPSRRRPPLDRRRVLSRAPRERSTPADVQRVSAQ